MSDNYFKSNLVQQDRAKVYPYANGEAFIGKDMSTVFSTIFENRVWNEQNSIESVSGSGSSIEQVQAILESLPLLLNQYNIHTVLDIPCGDFNWMRQLDWTTRKYIGADIVASLVQQNTSRYANDNIQFVHLDLTQDPLPASELIFCRDCLVHLSFEDIRKAVQNIKTSNSVYLLTTTFTQQVINEDITTGGWRPINLERAPFFFPEPIFIINEKCTEMEGIFQDKSLGLWKVSAL